MTSQFHVFCRIILIVPGRAWGQKGGTVPEWRGTVHNMKMHCVAQRPHLTLTMRWHHAGTRRFLLPSGFHHERWTADPAGPVKELLWLRPFPVKKLLTNIKNLQAYVCVCLSKNVLLLLLSIIHWYIHQQSIHCLKKSLGYLSCHSSKCK